MRQAEQLNSRRKQRAHVALLIAALLFLQPLATALAADTPLGRLAALMGPLCSAQIPGPGGTPVKAPAAADRVSCCLPGCPMAGGLPAADLVPPARPEITRPAERAAAPRPLPRALASGAWRQPRAPPASA